MTARNALSLALIGAGSMALAMPLSSQAAGFAEDAKVTLGLRNFYINRNFVDPAFSQGKAEEWTQSFILDARSGFSQGTVGFGLDVLGMSAFKLDGGKGTRNTGLLPIHDDGRPADNFGRLAVAAKAKVSKTELKVGEWMAVLPILRSDDGRALPQTFQGAQLSSMEIDGLSLYGGQFRQNSVRNDASMEDMTFGGASSDRFNFVGGEYRFNDNRTLVGLWNAELQDIYNQQYLQLSHSQPWAPTSATSAATKTAANWPASWTTGPGPACSPPSSAATPSMSACRKSAATPAGCASTAPAAAAWATTASTPATTTPANVPGSCVMTTTSLRLACPG